MALPPLLLAGTAGEAGNVPFGAGLNLRHLHLAREPRNRKRFPGRGTIPGKKPARRQLSCLMPFCPPSDSYKRLR